MPHQDQITVDFDQWSQICDNRIATTYLENGHVVILSWFPRDRCPSETEPLLTVTTTVCGLNSMDFAISGVMTLLAVLNLLTYVRSLPHI